MIVDTTAEKRTALTWLADAENEITDLSDTIWEFAEPALREYRSALAHETFLEARGFDVISGVSGMPTAFTASYGSGKPVIGMYGEYDAVPGASQAPVPFKEPVNGNPATGGFTDCHNGLGAGSTAAACAVKRAMERHDIPGTLKYFGTPAEKLAVGKCFMARDGHFDRLDAVVGWHPLDQNTVTLEPGPGLAKTYILDFKTESIDSGKPWLGTSALDAVTLTQVMTNFMQEHIGPHRDFPTLTELVTNGGQSVANTAPTTQLWYLTRAGTIETLDRIDDVVHRCGTAAGNVTGCEVNIRTVASVRSWVPNHTMANLAFENMKLVGEPSYSVETEQFARELTENLGYDPLKEPFDTTLQEPTHAKMDGVYDDVNEFSWHAPTCWIHTAYFPKELFGRAPHWPMSALAKTGAAHTSLLMAAKVMANTALDLLTRDDILNDAKAEYVERMDRRTNPPLLPHDVEPPVADSIPPYYPKGWEPPCG